MTGEPRKDRWIRLYDLGRALQKNDDGLSALSRRALRQRVYRMVRDAEVFNGERYTKRWRNRLYVNVSAIDRIKPVDDQRLGQLEIHQVEAAAKIRHLERQSNAHGSRIRNLEKWRELTQQYMADVAALQCAENDSTQTAKGARVGAHAR
jgi:hypothetical protein